MNARLAWVLAMLPGCIWVTDAEHAKRLCEASDADCPVADSDPDTDADTDTDTDPDTDVSDDADGDGYGADEDCDDADPGVNPGADELCADDGADRNCDGDPDAGAIDGTTWYPDTDGDGFGDEASAEVLCEDPEDERITQGGDCDDTDAAVRPGSTEDCATEGVDDDCDGDTTGVDGGALNCVDFFPDADGDDWGPIGSTDSHCQCEPAGDHLVLEDALGDCDDGDASVNPDNANCGLVLVGQIDPADADVTIVADGDDRLARLGTSMAVMEWNGSGGDDLVVGTPRNGGWGSQDGGAHVILPALHSGEVSLSTASHREFTGGENGPYGSTTTSVEHTRLGHLLATVADLDGSGTAAFLLTGPLEQFYGGGSDSPGGAAVVASRDPVGGSTQTASGEAVDRAWELVLGTGNVDLENAFGVGDLDGDGIDEMVFTSNERNHVAKGPLSTSRTDGFIAPYRESGTEWAVAWRPASLPPVESARGTPDIDGEGNRDLLLCSILSTGWGGGAYLLTGDPGWSVHQDRFENDTPWLVVNGESEEWQVSDGVVGDFDGDGALDLAMSARIDGTVTWDLVVVWDIQAARDLDPDANGATDADDDGVVHYRLDTGTLHTTTSGVGGGGSPLVFGEVVDLDLDGVDDLVMRASQYGLVAYGHADAPTDWPLGTNITSSLVSAAYLPLTSDTTVRPGVGDFNGDGLWDVAFADPQYDTGLGTQDGRILVFYAGG